MKRLLLVGLLILPFALSRTGARAEQEDAYGSLVGMADSAASDKGPQAGDIPAEEAVEDRRTAGAPSGDEPKTEFGSARAQTRENTAALPRTTLAAPKDDGMPSVSVPAVFAPRIWTKVFSSLIPAMTRVSSYEVAASTSPRRARPEPPRAATAASAEGGARGILELVAASTAPSLEP